MPSHTKAEREKQKEVICPEGQHFDRILNRCIPNQEEFQSHSKRNDYKTVVVLLCDLGNSKSG